VTNGGLAFTGGPALRPLLALTDTHQQMYALAGKADAADFWYVEVILWLLCFVATATMIKWFWLT
jgi:hypothetical protein